MSTLKVKKIKFCELRKFMHFTNGNVSKTKSLNGIAFSNTYSNIFFCKTAKVNSQISLFSGITTPVNLEDIFFSDKSVSLVEFSQGHQF